MHLFILSTSCLLAIWYVDAVRNARSTKQDSFSALCEFSKSTNESFIELSLKLGTSESSARRYLSLAERMSRSSANDDRKLTVAEIAAVYSYTDDSNTALNTVLGGNDDDSMDFDETDSEGEEAPKDPMRVCAYGWLLLRAMAKLPVMSNVDVYRGEPVRQPGDSLPKHEVGDILHWPAFSSASARREVAESFLSEDYGGRLLVISLTQGHARAVWDFSENPAEAKVLLPASTLLQVTGIQHVQKGSAAVEIVHAVEMPGESPMDRV
eukprot:TRINITY_DN32501_c0_g1_i2.p1 TRINITY_DN32501_c0_g1~~TRINITY_DN32501_c0_g1_i2.p1  ORF type:complete len:267 (+),score=26.17 TRINITY_DN32501_c0_g1_i2:85-885(+)